MTRKVRFDRMGISCMLCNIAAEVGGVVIALDPPYFSISNRKGEIVIPHVPPGRYMMRTWYETALGESLDAMTREIRVTENTSTLGVLEVPAGMPASAHKNKYGMDYQPPAPNTPAY